jgi:hypothetical protein
MGVVLPWAMAEFLRRMGVEDGIEGQVRRAQGGRPLPSRRQWPTAAGRRGLLPWKTSGAPAGILRHGDRDFGCGTSLRFVYEHPFGNGDLVLRGSKDSHFL